ncbi:hypothetical protein J5N97_014927 [Dioscorea zingiberensis]|uniref:FAF domain-containing protein n=1 Tax=Dioscorea zingiberensis TaxID=325984 RepID=A0A9D5CUD8_9LILI|nr:hypothetical protein J5N97_014927 [Dioscorea zingiberensis]
MVSSDSGSIRPFFFDLSSSEAILLLLPPSEEVEVLAAEVVVDWVAERVVMVALVVEGMEELPINPHRSRAIPIVQPDATSLRVLAGEIPKPRNVVASSAVGSAPKPMEWINPGAWGLHDPNDGGGLGLCTECLGFESLDERVVVGGDQGVEEIDKSDLGIGGKMARSRRRRQRSRRSLRRWPRSGKDGRKAVRTDGRILLTEVTIERPEILRASHGDGRLRLHFVRRDHEVDEEAVRWGGTRV